MSEGETIFGDTEGEGEMERERGGMGNDMERKITMYRKGIKMEEEEKEEINGGKKDTVEKESKIEMVLETR